MLIQGQLTIGVRVRACRGRVESGAQALTPTLRMRPPVLFQGMHSPVSQRKEGQERGQGWGRGQKKKRDRGSGACRGDHTMSFLGVPRDEGRIWFSMVTTCWSRGHTEFLDPFIPK